MWEAIEHRKRGNSDYTIWQRLDAEGRKVYQVTKDYYGMPVEPKQSGGVHYLKYLEF